MILGELEQQIMAVLWRSRTPLLVRDVQEALREQDRDLAYTTVMTVLDRLAKKDALQRDLDGRAWRYRPRKTCVDLHVEEILSLLDGCGEGHARWILDGVTDQVDQVTQPGRMSCGRKNGDPEAEPMPEGACSMEEWCHGALPEGHPRITCRRWAVTHEPVRVEPDRPLRP